MDLSRRTFLQGTLSIFGAAGAPMVLGSALDHRAMMLIVQDDHDFETFALGAGRVPGVQRIAAALDPLRAPAAIDRALASAQDSGR